jgi:uncharacterized protein (TIGR02246 family)
MNKKNYLLASLFMLFAVFIIGCNTTETKPTEAAAPAATDMGKVKTEIQTLETAWAAAENAGDTKALAAFYTDDAVSMGRDKPMIVGKEAIAKDIEAGMATRDKSMTIAYNVLDVFGDENTVTEVGTAIRKDSTGKVAYTGKYMAIWVKRDGKYLCIRDMSNSDAKEK